MPRYDFKCQRCGEIKTISQPITQDLENPSCCKQPATRIYSDLLFTLKGSGFYSTDNHTSAE